MITYLKAAVSAMFMFVLSTTEASFADDKVERIDLDEEAYIKVPIGDLTRLPEPYLGKMVAVEGFLAPDVSYVDSDFIPSLYESRFKPGSWPHKSNLSIGIAAPYAAALNAVGRWETCTIFGVLMAHKVEGMLEPMFVRVDGAKGARGKRMLVNFVVR